MSETEPREYVDIHGIHPDWEHRECVVCGSKWWHRYWMSDSGERKERADTTNCPHCRLEPLLNELAEKYVEHVQAYDGDYGNALHSHFWPHAKAMAYEASEIVGYGVNPMTCKMWFRSKLPEDSKYHTEQPTDAER